MKKAFLIPLFISGVVSCNSLKSDSHNLPGGIKEIIVATAKSQEKIDINEIGDSLQYVYLKENDNFYIGKVDKLKRVNNNFYVLDKNLAKSLFVFDAQGNPQLRLSAKISAGPGEFTSLDDFSIWNGSLYILSTRMRRILIYDKNGRYLKHIKLPEYFDNIEIMNNKIYCFRTSMLNKNDHYKNYSFLIFDMSLGKVARYLQTNPENDYYNYSTTDHNLIKTDSRICLSRWCCDTLYSFRQDSGWTKYFVNFGKDKINDQIKNKNNPAEFVKAVDEEKRSYVFSNFFETEKYIFFLFKQNGKLRFYVKDKEVENSITGDYFFNSHNKMPLPQPENINDGYILFAYSQDFLTMLKNNNILKPGIDLYDKFSNILEKTNSGFNPIIVSLKIKNSNHKGA